MFHWNRERQCRLFLVLFQEVTDSTRNWTSGDFLLFAFFFSLHGNWPLQTDQMTEIFLNFSGDWNFGKSYWRLREVFSAENYLNSLSYSLVTWPRFPWKELGLQCTLLHYQVLASSLGQVHIMPSSTEWTKRIHIFTCEIAKCYSTCDLQNIIMQKYPRSFTLSIFTF